MTCTACVYRHVSAGFTSQSKHTEDPVEPQSNHEPKQLDARVRWALVGLSLSMLLSSLGTSITNVALPTLAAAFGTSFQSVQWIVLAYLLAITSSIVSVGRVGDLYGRRRVLMGGLFLFTAASVLSGVSHWLWLVIAARAAQGFGAAIMMSLTMAFVADVVPKERTGSAMGLLGTTSAIGTALGPSVGGMLTAQFGWPAIFFINVPLGIFALLLVDRYLPADGAQRPTRRVRFDHAGTLLLALTLAAYSLAMTMGRGSFGLLNVGLLAAAALGASLLLVVERRVESPLVRLAMFRDRALSASLAMNLLVSTVLMATLVVGPFYLSLALGLEAGVVGVVMSVGPLVAALTGMPAGMVVDSFGTGRTTVAGLIGILVGALLLAVMPEAYRIPGYVAPIVLITANYAFFQAANNTAVMRDVHPEQRGVVSGLLSLSRNLGLVTGASLMGAVFAFGSGSTDITTAPAHHVAVGMRITFAVASGLIVMALAIGLGNRVPVAPPSPTT